ncbi:hypothetical protein KC909_03855 [Candidatus Dojkabacteria bacterium]|uniref:Uncharacterized protein n=1 Tax=Candidatus Dojkabacteria bacterium TaxID=2099670 RepID=A0A955RJK1_9BACT|nr:hypothetical protein [Candidatus Dojkabacteria bacterium]
MTGKAKTAYVASEALSEKIKKLQDELKLKSPGEVIAMGLSLIELSLGREIEFHEDGKVYKSSKFKGHNQTVELE